MATRNVLDLAPGSPDASAVALFAAALADTRRRTLEALRGVSQAEIDRRPGPASNGIGTLLYHLALIEADWLYVEILERSSYPEAARARLPWPDRDASGRLTPVLDVSLEDHLSRLAWVRRELERALAAMPEPEFRRRRRLPAYEASPAYVVHHLMQHEAQHRGEILLLRRMAATAA